MILEVQNLKELEGDFLEVRILKGLVHNLSKSECFRACRRRTP
jgi:hypothetical protein